MFDQIPPKGAGELLVVNGVVASPFALNHAVADAYYNIHRGMYRLAPWLLRLPAVVKANLVFGSVVESFG